MKILFLPVGCDQFKTPWLLDFSTVAKQQDDGGWLVNRAFFNHHGRQPSRLKAPDRGSDRTTGDVSQQSGVLNQQPWHDSC